MTTKSPIDEVQGAVERTFLDIFSGGDINAAKVAFSNQFKSLGGNIARADVFLDAMGSVASLLAPNPTDIQKVEIKAKIANLLAEGIKFVKSQQGLENVDMDPDIINDSQFTTFLANYDRLKKETDTISLNPEGSYDYFMNVADDYSSFLVSMVQTSKDVQAKKAAASV